MLTPFIKNTIITSRKRNYCESLNKLIIFHR
ncbi:hypothetical protein VP393E501_P0050 [Vibrio phage 393E50-1]|nr:hypothetical protein VP393E501_P0050 [Vibrio phage 393E50-1]